MVCMTSRGPYSHRPPSNTLLRNTDSPSNPSKTPMCGVTSTTGVLQQKQNDLSICG